MKFPTIDNIEIEKTVSLSPDKTLIKIFPKLIGLHFYPPLTSEFLKEFEPDFFFDDQTGHCQSAASVAPTGHVVSGVSNKIKNSN